MSQKLSDSRLTSVSTSTESAVSSVHKHHAPVCHFRHATPFQRHPGSQTPSAKGYHAFQCPQLSQLWIISSKQGLTLSLQAVPKPNNMMNSLHGDIGSNSFSTWTTSLIIHLYYMDLGEVQRRQWHPTPVFLPGESHGRRSLVGCSPWGR